MTFVKRFVKTIAVPITYILHNAIPLERRFSRAIYSRIWDRFQGVRDQIFYEHFIGKQILKWSVIEIMFTVV